MSSASPAPRGPIGHNNSLQVPPAEGNLSFVLQKVDHIEFEERPVQAPLPNQVQVNVRQTGICGSDTHYWKHGSIGDFILRKPMVLGHESAGIVTAVGKDVKSHKVGDRVALEPGEPCGACQLCRSGFYYHCKDLAFAATPPYDGTLATYYNLHSAYAHKVPDNMSLESASLMEPLSVGVQAAVAQGKVQAMQNVLVFGAGPVGLLSAAVCKAMGAKRVVVVDVVQEKLNFAKEFCATSTFLPTPAQPDEDKMAASERNAKALIDQVGDDVKEKEGFDLILECTGAPPCIQMAIFAARMRSRIVQVGMGPRDVLLPLWRVGIKEIEIVGTFRYGAICYPLAIELASSGRIDVTKLVTHRYPFSESMKAFEAVSKGKGEDGKATIKVQISQGEAKA